MAYTILIVEDSKLINDNLKKSLEQDGHQIEQAFDIARAIDLIQEQRFDYILLDLILPDGEGEMLLPYAKHADARVIVMTTDRDSFRRDRLFGFGIVDYIIKERYFDDIVDNIRKIFRQVESNVDYTILVVDDSNFIRNNIELLLHSRGFLVLTASNGKEALNTMEKYKIDALIADLEMPVLDGFALLAKIRRKKEYRNLPVVILTGSNDSNKIAKVIKNDVKDLIKKPYVIEELLLKIDNMMNALRQGKTIEEERQKFAIYHEAIVNSTLYMKLSPDYNIHYMNGRLQRLLFGLNYQNKLPVHLKDLIKNPTLEFFRSLQKLSPDSPPVDYIFRFENSETAECYVSAVISGIFDIRGQLIEMIFIGHDITQLQLNEHQLQSRVKEQTQVNIEQQQMMFNQAKMAAMGEMIGNIAHQWRQPLNTLGLLIQDLDDAHVFGELDDAYLHTMIDKSMDQIQYMSKTIDDFRNFYQPNKYKERFDIVDAVHKTVNIVDRMFQAHSITLNLKGMENGIYIVEGYPNEIQQVLLNLLNNAKDAVVAQYGECNESNKWIRISLESNKGSLTLRVSDSGGGIPDAIMERIFEPYYTTKEEGKGTGVGLYMSKMIVEQNMGCKLQAYNEPEGACFEIVFPSLTLLEDASEFNEFTNKSEGDRQ